MNQYEELIYSLIANCNREITKEEKKILNQASAIYNTYNNLTDELGCPLEVVVKALNMIIIYKVDVRQVMNCDTVDDYNSSGWFSSRMKLNNEQFVFLKGVFEKWIKS